MALLKAVVEVPVPVPEFWENGFSYHEGIMCG